MNVLPIALGLQRSSPADDDLDIDDDDPEDGEVEEDEEDGEEEEVWQVRLT